MISSLQSLDWHGFLERPPLPPPPQHRLDTLAAQPILMTGAGGSIGSALALRLAALRCPRLVLLEASESNLYALERDWPAACPMTPILGSTGDRALLDDIFSTHAPRLVFHAAAFKHVPLMEQQPLAAMANNIFATETLTRAAEAHGACVVLVSTDKAVEPASVMGATKRVAEQIVLSRGGAVLRLANVLASRDSVAEVFARQIAQGGPLTVTDQAARRYFLTLNEAVNLLLAAGALLPAAAAHNEPSALLAPVLPDPHFIADLARFMARTLRPELELVIEFTGLRPGDKETESLWSPGSRISPASLAGLVSVETAQSAPAQLTARLASLRTALESRDLALALGHLRALVPDYTPSPAVLALARRSSPQVCV